MERLWGRRKRVKKSSLATNTIVKTNSCFNETQWASSTCDQPVGPCPTFYVTGSRGTVLVYLYSDFNNNDLKVVFVHHTKIIYNFYNIKKNEKQLYNIFILCLSCKQVWFKDFIYFQREEKGGKKGERHQCVVTSCVPPTGDLAHNPGVCPDQKSNQQPIGSQTSIQSTELHQPGLKRVFLNLFFI